MRRQPPVSAQRRTAAAAAVQVLAKPLQAASSAPRTHQTVIKPYQAVSSTPQKSVASRKDHRAREAAPANAAHKNDDLTQRQSRARSRTGKRRLGASDPPRAGALSRSRRYGPEQAHRRLRANAPAEAGAAARSKRPCRSRRPTSEQATHLKAGSPQRQAHTHPQIVSSAFIVFITLALCRVGTRWAFTPETPPNASLYSFLPIFAHFSCRFWEETCLKRF